MLLDHAIEWLTRDQWLRVLSEHCEYQLPSSHSRGRRKQTRFRMLGWATLRFEATDNVEKETVYPKCRVSDVSDEGLAVHSTWRIAPDTIVSIELYTSGHHFCLSGRVVYCSGLPGFVRLGIKLEFPATGSHNTEAGA